MVPPTLQKWARGFFACVQGFQLFPIRPSLQDTQTKASCSVLAHLEGFPLKKSNIEDTSSLLQRVLVDLSHKLFNLSTITASKTRQMAIKQCCEVTNLIYTP